MNIRLRPDELEEDPARAGQTVHIVRYFLLGVAIASLFYCGFVFAQATWFQGYQSWAFDRQTRGLESTTLGYIKDKPLAWFFPKHETIEATVPPPPAVPRPEQYALLGRLVIPRLDMRVMVREGDDDGTLRMAVGHVPSTSLPGEVGNVAIAAHRDTFFRGLRGIKTNDRILFETLNGVYEYEVASTKIVEPTDVAVLRASGGSTLTLITCYPFDFVGSAPQRFIVRAVQVAKPALPSTEAASVVPVAAVEKPAPRKHRGAGKSRTSRRAIRHGYSSD